MQKLSLPLAIIIAAILVGGAILYDKPGSAQGGTKQNDPPARQEVSLDDDARMGEELAPVKIVEFSDFQCPFCRSFWQDTLPLIKKNYIDTGKAVFVYRDYPLSFHAAAQISAEAAECAKDQNKYWEMHDKIFSEQSKKGQGTITYGESDIKKWAGEIGLNMVTFNQCLTTHKHKSEIEADFADGSAAGVSGTPNTFINGIAVVGAQPYSVFEQVIEEELKKVSSKKDSFFK